MRRRALHDLLTLCLLIAGGAFLLAVGSVSAQEADDESGQAGASGQNQEGDDQPEGQDASDRDERRPGRGDWGGQRRDQIVIVRRLHESVRKEIRLRDEQIPVINKLFEDHIAHLTEMAKEREAKREENAGKIEELRDQLQAAREQDDQETVRRLSQELRELFGGGQEVMDANRNFNAAVIEELDEEQAKVFTRLTREVMSVGPQARNRLREIQVMNRALREVQLTPEQKEATDKIFVDLRGKLAEARPHGDEAISKLIDDTREGILAQLDDSQKEEFAAAEERVRKMIQEAGAQRREGRLGDRRGQRPEGGNHEAGPDKPNEAPPESDAPGGEPSEDDGDS